MPGRSSIIVSMNKLASNHRAEIIGMMVEGVPNRAITHMTAVSKNNDRQCTPAMASIIVAAI
jgi:hypothetical protein